MSRRTPFSLSVSLVAVLLTISAMLFGLMGNPRPVYAAGTPSVAINAPADSFIGEAIKKFSVSFTNSGSSPGYGPYVDLVLPATVTGINGPEPGIAFTNAKYLGAAVTSTVLTFPSGGTGCVAHPYAVDSTNTPLQICGTSGYQLVVLQLPFGSFTPGQPTATIDIAATINSDVDLTPNLPITASAGFRYGNDPLDNPATDPSIVGSAVTTSIKPILYRLTKKYIGPEDETATGPNFPRQYLITADIANGQTLTNFDLTDILANNVQFLSVDQTAIRGTATATTAISTPPATPGGILTRRFASVTGTTAADDATMLFSFYVPKVDNVGANVIDPVTGAFVISNDDAKASGSWLPTDGDPSQIAVSDVTPIDHTLTDKSIAIQKTVAIATDTGAIGYTPGDTIEYTLNFQVSDYFSVDSVIATDLMRDGQTFDASFTPTISVSERGNTVSGNVPVAAYTVDTSQIGNDTNPATDGTTKITFNVSNAITALGAPDGILRGGRSFLPNAAGTIGVIKFRATINDKFTDTYLPADDVVNHGDTITNDASIKANILDNTTLAVTGNQTDTTQSKLVIIGGTLVKSIYAVNGVVCSPQPCSTVKLAARDTVTYRLAYDLPTSNFEQFSMQDYLPLPIFSAPTLTTFDDVAIGATPSGAAPAIGHITFGPADTYHNESARPTPTLTTDATKNSATLAFANYDGPNTPSLIDFLLTVQASDAPFADGLFLTNQAHVDEGSTNGGTISQNAIVQLLMTEPELNIKKGVIATDRASAIFSPATVGPVAFTPPGSAGTRFAGTINSNGLTATPINSDLNGIDANDTVSFAIVVENRGTGLHGAFDINIADTLPAGFAIPSTGLNLRVTNGAGTALAYTGSDPISTGITLNDTLGNGALRAYDTTNGQNIAIITYDLIATGSVAPRQQLTNTATIRNYASAEGGADFTPYDLTDDATAQVSDPSVAKTIVSTNQAHTAGNNVAIGEQVQYQVVITVPESVSHNTKIIDTLDPGLALVSLDSIVASPALATSATGGFNGALGAATVVNTGGGAANDGRLLTIDLGTLTNSDTNNVAIETITVRYTALVINTTGNTRGVNLKNNAQYQWNEGAGTQSVGNSAPNVTVVEPQLDVVKSATPNSGDAGDTITYSIVVNHSVTSNADAFNASLSDVIPSGMTYVAGSLTSTGTAPTSLIQSAGTISASWNAFVLGSSTTIIFQVTLDGSVTPAQVIANTATIAFTSLPGTVTTAQSSYNTLSTERTGSAADPGGSANTYVGSSTANVTVIVPNPQKSLVTTSEAHTAGSSVAIGEIVRYRLVVRVAEGTAPNFVLRENLPTGLTFLNDGTVKLALAANALGNLASSDAALSGARVGGYDETNIATLTPSFVLPASAISNATNPGGAFVSGDVARFSLGTLTNSESDANDELVVLEFNALVDNNAGNQAGSTLDNTFTVSVNGSDIATSPAVTVNVVEPQVSSTKTVKATAPVKAGDTISYDIVVTNSNAATSATAYNLRVQDALDSNLTFTGVTVVSKPVTTSTTNNSVAPNVDIGIDQLGVGESLTLRVTATVNTVSASGVTIPNTATTSYTSLPGANGTTSNPTGSSNTGAGGSATGERNGSGGTNDYIASGSSPLSLGTIGDHVYFDANGNGSQSSAAEPGISGVTVRLTTAGPDGILGNGDDVTVSTITDINGFYQFTGLTVGSYQVTVDTTTLPGGTTATADRDATADSTTTVNLGPAQVVADADFGYRGTGTLGDYVWFDTNGDGVQDASEQGIKGIGVALTWAGADGVFGTADDALLTTTTGINGAYSFTGLPAGNYRVTVPSAGLPSGLSATYDLDAGTLGTADTTLTAGQNRTNADFGYRGNTSLGDDVWLDVNGDGVYNPGEEGIAGVKVDLVWYGPDGVAGGGDDITFTTTTDANGKYLFSNLPGGAYQVSVDTTTLPAGVAATYDVDPGTGLGIADITLVSGTNRTDVDFGYRGSGSIGDLVWFDSNGNGVADAGEPGLANVDVTVRWAGPDGVFGNADDIVTATKTDANGNYTVSGLPAGSYQVTADSADVPAGSVLSTSANPLTVTLASGASVTTADFGFKGNGSLGDTVWLDRDGNGAQNAGEPGIPGITVNLIWAGPDGNVATTADNASYTTTTNASGAYSFTGLPTGNFQVTVANAPASLTPSFDYDGTATANSATVVLTTATPSRTDVDFGYTGTASIGDLVWFDSNGDGVADAGEPGLANVHVTVTWYGLDGVAGGSDDLTITTVTDSSGAYSVGGLPAGNYAVSVTAADVPGNTTATTTVAPFSLTTSEAKTTVDFGFKGTGSLGDTVWLDRNGDGVQNAGEPGIGGVNLTVTWAGPDGNLTTAADNVTYPATTSASGAYSVGNLPAGLYSVTVATASLPGGVNASYDLNGGNDSTTTATLTTLTPSRTDVDFGYRGTGAIGDQVWFDANGDGVQNAGEPGLANITITLYWAGPDGIFGTADDASFTTTTAADGSYSFGSLPAGNYKVDIDTADPDLPVGMALTTGVDPTPITLTAGQTVTTADFGFTATGSIGDRVWNDANNNGLQDGSETGLIGVAVTVTWAGQDGVFGTADDYAKTVTTGANGLYSVGGLPAGSYQITIDSTTVPAGLNPSYDADGILTPNIAATTLTVGQNRSDIDFGYSTLAPLANSALGDRVWRDTNGNGVQDAGEAGIVGVKVTLLAAGPDGVFGSADDSIKTTTTGANGIYSFTNLPAGDYRVSIDGTTIPAGLGETYEVDGSLNGSALVALAAGATRTDVDFGYTPLNAGGTTGQIGDRIWNDANGNGIQDGGEQGITGVKVTLTGAGPDGVFGTADDTTKTTTTGTNGAYLFDSLPAGQYRVVIDAATLPAGLSETYELDSSRNGSVNVTLTQGEKQLNVDFGYTTGSVAPATGSIGDTVWFDLNGDGVKGAGESGIPGVTVNLTWFGPDGVAGTADDVSYSQVTGAGGGYSFSGLPAGNYRVVVDTTTLPSGMVATFDLDGGNNSSANLTLAAGQNRTDVDFGYTGTGSIGDRIWNDTDGNGLQDPAETGISGVTVTLTWAGRDGVFGTADDVVTTTPTGANGFYSFSNLPGGAYQVAVDGTAAALAGKGESYERDGSFNGNAAVQLLPGENISDVDFGYTAPPPGGTGSIGDTVWLDLNGNGTQDAGEPGLAGVTVQLISAGADGVPGTADDLIFTQVTGANGGYNFTGLPGNVYQVIVDTGSLPSGLIATKDRDATADSKTTVTLAPGQTVTNADFGYSGSGSIGDYVWNDTNGDGVPDASESGIGNATVSLTWAGPDGVVGTSDDVVLTTATNPTGGYTFAGLPAGSYVVTIDPATLPPGMLPTYDADGGTPDLVNLGLGVGQNRPTIDFGFTVPKIDLALTKSDGGVTPVAGGTLVYTLDYANLGNFLASGVTITENVPAHTRFNATASDAGWVCSGATCSYTVGNVARAATGGIVFAVDIDKPLPAGVNNLVNTASISDDASNGSDVVPANNNASLTTPVNAAPDLTLVKTDGGAHTVAGGTISYTLNYANVGTQDATGVVLTEKVPANTTFDATKSSAGWVCAGTTPGSTCTLAIGALAAGSSGTATFAVTVDSVLPSANTSIANTAVLADDMQNGIDPTSVSNLNQNPASVTTGPAPTAITLVSFTATRQADGSVVVRWTTSSELNTFGFHILRGSQRASAVQVTPQLILAGRGGATYEWVDRDAPADATLSYWLKEIETSGGSNEYGPVRVAGTQPSQTQTRVFLPMLGR